MALQNQTTSSTRLDVPTAHRHDVLSSKQVIIGCGGGFRHECASRYSPVAQWMSEVDLALQDESQQYGNLDETAAIARLPCNCLVLWLGDIVKLRAVSANPLGCSELPNWKVLESFKDTLPGAETLPTKLAFLRCCLLLCYAFKNELLTVDDLDGRLA